MDSGAAGGAVRTVAALYVQPRGVYYGIEGVEPWGLPEWDARLYEGPHPVVAHPPCARWGRYYAGRPGHPQFERGDDGGCFEAALSAVRRWGGVLEHPIDSSAWEWFGLDKPPRAGGWVPANDKGLASRAHGQVQGWTCTVWQGWYGHRAAKPTWLYVRPGGGTAAGADLG